MKKFLSISLVCLTVFSVFFSAHVVKANTNELHNHSNDIGILYVPCPVSGGKHIMSDRGTGQAHLSNGEIFTGYLFQCKNCNFAIILEYSPLIYPKPSVPGRYVADTLPRQAPNGGYEFYTSSSLLKSDSWTSGIFQSMTFVLY